MTDYPRIDVDLSRIGPAMSHWSEIDALREAHRFFWNSSGNHWVLTRYDDIREAFQNPAVFSNHSIVATDPDPAYRFLPSFIDPPQHMKYRQTMNKWFAPAAVARFRPELARLAQQSLSRFVDDGRCDFTATFGDTYPVTVFLHSMGLPPNEDADYFVSCVRRLSGNFVDPEEVKKVMGAWADISSYWTDLLAARRANPKDPEVDFVTHMLGATIDGRPLPDDEIVDIMVTLTIGSLDTLKAQLGWCFYHLATRPDDRRRLVESPDLVPSAVEEFLRAYPIVSMARKLKEDIDFHGCPMKKGDMVLLTIQAATRDPRQFPNPEEVVLDREPNRHIAFGASEHRCLGSHLARAELQIAIEEWHRLIPDYWVDSDQPLMAHGGQVSLVSLPLAWSR